MRSRESADVWHATPPVRLDTCDEHGVWLERGVLEMLIRRARLDVTRQRRVSRLKHDIRVEDDERASAIEDGVFSVFRMLS